MWIAELVKNAITGHRNTPRAKVSPGHRYFRQPRMCQTSRPARASASRHNPTKRMQTAKSQWTISAGGCTVPLQVGEQRPCDDEREDEAGDGDEQRRLDREPPEALPVRVQQRNAARLQDRPDEPPSSDERPDQRNCVRTDVVLL